MPELQEPYTPRLPTPREAWTAAGIVISDHGGGAADYARGRIAGLEEAGDDRGASAWRIILGRIEALLAAPKV